MGLLDVGFEFNKATLDDEINDGLILKFLKIIGMIESRSQFLCGLKVRKYLSRTVYGIQ